MKFLEKLITIFPIFAIILSIISYFNPEFFTSLKFLIIPLLAVIMLGMGLSLKIDDFKRVFFSPTIVFLGVAIQYLLMPLVAYILSITLNLSDELTIGMMLVGASAGGTASNVITYISKGDVALSISMTMISTLLAIILTPFICNFYLGQTVDVPVINMISSIFQIVILPVLIGTIINTLKGEEIRKLQPIFALISTFSIVLIIAIIIALNKGKLEVAGFNIFIAVILHNLIGMLGGYQIPRLLGFSGKQCRTVAIEVGMQNSGLSVALAIKFFTATSAIPGAIFSIWHNLSGSILAIYWRGKNDD